MDTEKRVQLSAEEIQAIAEGLRSEQEEPISTMDEAFEEIRSKRKEWLKIQSA